MSVLDTIRRDIGRDNVLTHAAAAAYLTDWRERYHGRCLAVVMPASTQEVAQVVRACADTATPVVPQGGNTGTVGGATPDTTGQAIVLSLKRLNRIRDINTTDNTLTVEAGCTLQAVHECAAQAQRLYPLSLASREHCTLGGNLATNAGGTAVLRYGMTRDLTLGLEVVTADGKIWNGLRGLRKDNSAYDLRNLFIGSEGSLGIITAATLKLYPQPAATRTALLAVHSIDDAMAVYEKTLEQLDASLTGFELMAGDLLDDVIHQFPEHTLPIQADAGTYPWYVLLELSDSESDHHATQRLQTFVTQNTLPLLAHAIARDGAQARAFWALRYAIPVAEKAMGPMLKHDIGIPPSRMARFVTDCNAALQRAYPGTRNIVFGHLGDGNLHYNLAAGGEWSQQRLLAEQEAAARIVYDHVHAANGTISAEHGIGQVKHALLATYKSPTEMALMRTIKHALDPQGIMNPGKFID